MVLVAQNNILQPKDAIMFEIIDENLNISKKQLKNEFENNSITINEISDISQSIALSIRKINQNPRIKTPSTSYSNYDFSYLETIAQNRQHRFESRLSWNKDSKANDINSQRIDERKRKMLENL